MLGGKTTLLLPGQYHHTLIGIAHKKVFIPFNTDGTKVYFCSIFPNHRGVK